MAYAVRADLLRYMSSSALDDIGDETAINAKLIDVQTRVDAVIRDRYALPLATVDPALTDCVCRIARYELFLTYGSNRSGDLDFYERDRDSAMAFLRDVSLRKASLAVGQSDASADDTLADQGPLAVATSERRGYHKWTR